MTQQATPSRAPLEVNYDESKVPPYTLPDPLVFADGRPVKTKDDWRTRRREILDIFAREMYGAEPPRPEVVNTELLEESVAAAGFAVRRRYINCHARLWILYEICV